MLLSIAEHRRPTGSGARIADLLHVPEGDEMGFDPPHLPDLALAADLS